MPKATRDYGFARDCAVCGARIPKKPKYEFVHGDKKHPMCEYCARATPEVNFPHFARRIASGAYKVVPDK